MSATQSTRPRPGSKLAVLLDMLEQHAPAQVGLNILMREARCGAVHSSIAKLRTKGFWIENKLERQHDGQMLSTYTLLAE